MPVRHHCDSRRKGRLMTTGTRERDNLYIKLREVLGTEQATTMMGYFSEDRQSALARIDFTFDELHKALHRQTVITIGRRP